MKAGTTTLFRDLRTNQSIFLPAEKEPHTLINDDVFTPSGTSAYEALFANAKSNQQCGEASTGYTKFPDNQNVPKRAYDLLGPDLKLIYIVRDPIHRLVSQYHHEVFVSGLTMQIDEAIRNFPPLVNYSKYAMQIEPWIEQFSRTNIKIIIFEEYVKNRMATIDSVCSFLGVPSNANKIEEDSIFNKGSGRPLKKGPFSAFAKTSFYQKCIRHFIPLWARDSLRKQLLPKSPPKAMPTRESVEWAAKQLEDDLERFRDIIYLQELPWDISNSINKYS
jgi:hypothetical protein